MMYVDKSMTFEKRAAKSIFSAFLALIGFYVLLLAVSIGSLFAAEETSLRPSQHRTISETVSSNARSGKLSDADKRNLERFGRDFERATKSRNLILDESSNISLQDKGLANVMLFKKSPPKVSDDAAFIFRSADSAPLEIAKFQDAQTFKLPIDLGSLPRGQSTYSNRQFFPEIVTENGKKVLKIKMRSVIGYSYREAVEDGVRSSNFEQQYKDEFMTYKVKDGVEFRKLEAFLSTHKGIELSSHNGQYAFEASEQGSSANLTLRMSPQSGLTVSKDTPFAIITKSGAHISAKKADEIKVEDYIQAQKVAIQGVDNFDALLNHLKASAKKKSIFGSHSPEMDLIEKLSKPECVEKI